MLSRLWERLGRRSMIPEPRYARVKDAPRHACCRNGGGEAEKADGWEKPVLTLIRPGFCQEGGTRSGRAG